MIIERWIENRRHIFYRFHVRGAHLVVSRVVDGSVIPEKDPRSESAREKWFFDLQTTERFHGNNDPPFHIAVSIVRFCPHFRLDFGAFDVVEDDPGECYIIDVNARPY